MSSLVNCFPLKIQSAKVNNGVMDLLYNSRVDDVFGMMNFLTHSVKGISAFRFGFLCV